jgi:hypothetical protein
MALRERFTEWYRGRWVPPPPPGRHVVFLMGHYEQPRLARILGVLGRFWLAHWQWIIGTALVIIGIVVAL